jgi:hypothetical protein
MKSGLWGAEDMAGTGMLWQSVENGKKIRSRKARKTPGCRGRGIPATPPRKITRKTEHNLGGGKPGRDQAGNNASGVAGKEGVVATPDSWSGFHPMLEATG